MRSFADPSFDPNDEQIVGLMRSVLASVRRRRETAAQIPFDHPASLPNVGRARPSMTVVAGPNGSGKTSVTEEMIRAGWLEGCVCINPDSIANSMFGGWNSKESFIKAALHAEKLRGECLESRQSFIFETVLSTSGKLEFMTRAMAAGFVVRLIFIGTERPEINVARIAKRVREGGHDVPADKIISRHPRSLANCIRAAAVANRALVFDNSVEDQPPRLLFRAVDGRLASDVRPSGWSELIYGALSDWQAADRS